MNRGPNKLAGQGWELGPSHIPTMDIEMKSIRRQSPPSHLGSNTYGIRRRPQVYSLTPNSTSEGPGLMAF